MGYAPAVALVVFLTWASSPLWRITAVLPDGIAWLIPVGQAVSYIGVLGALLCLVLVCWQGWRRRSLRVPLLALVVTAAALVPVTLVTSQAGGSGRAGADGTVRVMALNTYFNQADDESIASETRRVDPDVLVLSETAPGEVATVEERTGLVATGPVSESGRASGTAVLVRDTPGATGVADTSGDLGLTGHQTPFAQLSDPSTVDVIGVHTLPPAFSDLIDGWQRDLATLRNAFGAQDEPLILAGDFNATVAHPEFRDLLDTVGLERCGEGGVTGSPTWPSSVPFVRIDHILVRDGSCGDSGTVQVDGTDHRGVWADVHL